HKTLLLIDRFDDIPPPKQTFFLVGSSLILFLNKTKKRLATRQYAVGGVDTHVLPKGFTRIRHYGILSSYYKKIIVQKLQQDLGRLELPERKPLQHNKCPSCEKGKLITLTTFTARGPPYYWQQQFKKQVKSLSE